MTTYKHKVCYYETDKMGITHHSNYVRWMEEARTDFLEQLGWSYDKLEAEGIFSPVTKVECNYKESTTYADIVEIEVCLSEFRGVRLAIDYIMKKADGSIACTARSEHCFLNKSGRILRLERDYPEFYQALINTKL